MASLEKKIKREYDRRYRENHKEINFNVDLQYYDMIVETAVDLGLTRSQFLKQAVDRYLQEARTLLGKGTSPDA